jgi:hypothetical protein
MCLGVSQDADMAFRLNCGEASFFVWLCFFYRFIERKWVHPNVRAGVPRRTIATRVRVCQGTGDDRAAGRTPHQPLVARAAAALPRTTARNRRPRLRLPAAQMRAVAPRTPF